MKMCQHYAHGTFQGGYPLLVPAVMRRMKRLVGLIPFLYVSSPKAPDGSSRRGSSTTTGDVG